MSFEEGREERARGRAALSERGDRVGYRSNEAAQSMQRWSGARLAAMEMRRDLDQSCTDTGRMVPRLRETRARGQRRPGCGNQAENFSLYDT